MATPGTEQLSGCQALLENELRSHQPDVEAEGEDKTPNTALPVLSE